MFITDGNGTVTAYTYGELNLPALNQAYSNGSLTLEQLGQALEAAGWSDGMRWVEQDPDRLIAMLDKPDEYMDTFFDVFMASFGDYHPACWRVLSDGQFLMILESYASRAPQAFFRSPLRASHGIVKRLLARLSHRQTSDLLVPTALKAVSLLADDMPPDKILECYPQIFSVLSEYRDAQYAAYMLHPLNRALRKQGWIVGTVRTFNRKGVDQLQVVSSKVKYVLEPDMQSARLPHYMPQEGDRVAVNPQFCVYVEPQVRLVTMWPLAIVQPPAPAT